MNVEQWVAFVWVGSAIGLIGSLLGALGPRQPDGEPSDFTVGGACSLWLTALALFGIALVLWAIDHVRIA